MGGGSDDMVLPGKGMFYKQTIIIILEINQLNYTINDKNMNNHVGISFSHLKVQNYLL